MTPWEIALQILKFLSLGVSTASGWYATLSDTREKDPPHKLTRAGRIVFRCLIISSVVALVSQILETTNTLDKLAKDKHEKEVAAAEDSRKRKEQLDRLDTIIGTAEKASSNSEASAKQSGVAVNRLATVIDNEEVAKENTWREQRPFGSWFANLSIHGISVRNSENTWVKKALQRWEQEQHAQAHYGDTPTIEDVYTEEDSSDSEKNVFVHPFKVLFYRTSWDNNPDYALNLYPRHASTEFHFDQAMNVTSVNLAVQLKGVETTRTERVTNWIDLFGGQMEVFLVGPGVDGDIDLDIGYEDTIAPHVINFVCDDSCETQELGDDKTMAHMLTESNLGSFPEDYQKLFPSRLPAIEARIRKGKKQVPAIRVPSF